MKKTDNLTVLDPDFVSFEEVAEKMFDSLGQVIPYDRIGVGVLSPDHESLELVWVKSKLPARYLKQGYCAPLKGSSLENLLIRDQPRIIADLEDYLRRHPNSESTRRAVEDGIRSSLTYPLRSSTGLLGVVFFSSYSVGAYSESHLNVFSLIGTTISISLEREMEKSKRLALSNRENFYRKALHDLRSPLNVARGQVDLALGGRYGSINPEIEKAMASIKKQVEEMIDLLNHIQDALELGVADFKVIKQEVSLGSYLDNIALAAETLTSSRGVSFKLEKENLPAKASFDPQRINQVIGNLLTNALKFSKSNTKISLKVKNRDNGLHFVLQDQGSGIASSELHKIFEKKEVLKGGNQTSFDRSQGLGLSIVKKIIEDHGGTVWVESQLGVGSQFHFIVPSCEQGP